ncbi:hypothetical protein [uncultured Microbacterium sp.]|uniref:hypothetical protein n=1 Tax=uncultured Microbacterium sp. TaxID=191216 RepID=UPI0035CC7F73
MPTALPRIQVTRTPELDRALEVAARMWPDAPLSERITRLAELGADAVSGAEQTARAEGLRRLRELTADLYQPGYLHDLREDWDR